MGGVDSYATVHDGAKGLFRYYMPEKDYKQLVDELTAKAAAELDN